MLILTILLNCFGVLQTDQSVSQSEERMSYIPPVNFGMVEDDLYRSGQPKQMNFPFMETLGLKKIIYLAPDEPSARL